MYTFRKRSKGVIRDRPIQKQFIESYINHRFNTAKAISSEIGIAHAQYHVIYKHGVSRNHIFGIPTPLITIHFVTFGATNTMTTKAPFRPSASTRPIKLMLKIGSIHTDRVDARQLICINQMSDVSLSYT